MRITNGITGGINEGRTMRQKEKEEVTREIILISSIRKGSKFGITQGMGR